MLQRMMLDSLVSYALLYMGLLVHELGHILGGMALGYKAKTLVIGGGQKLFLFKVNSTLVRIHAPPLDSASTIIDYTGKMGLRDVVVDVMGPLFSIGWSIALYCYTLKKVPFRSSVFLALIANIVTTYRTCFVSDEADLYELQKAYKTTQWEGSSILIACGVQLIAIVTTLGMVIHFIIRITHSKE